MWEICNFFQFLSNFSKAMEFIKLKSNYHQIASRDNEILI